jgi:potassium efflux system protein
MDDFLKTVLGYVMPAYDVALAWIINPANSVQVALLVGAYVVGIGFGLQKIASNFVSGVILLLEGQATVGDYVELDGGEAGTIVKMTARAAILETFDGKWIVVPNEDFIVTWVINYSDSGSANRDEVFFP